MSNFSYEVFSTVAQKKTFLEAAKELKVTPSAVSHSINNFEKELGFSLFIRNRSGVQLTTNGKRILPLVQEILNAELNLKEEASLINGVNTGRVRIGAFSSVCINWLPDIINQFKEKYPNIEVTVWQGNFNAVIEQLKLGNIDIGFSALPISDTFEVTKLFEDEIYCITPKDVELKEGSKMTKNDLKDKNFILQQIDYDRDTKKALDTYDVSLNSIHYSIDDASIIAMVESGLGYGILPKLALEKLKGNVNQYLFDQEFHRQICLVTHEKKLLTPSVRSFSKVVINYIRNRYGKTK
ncbi:lysr family transcriptional regulator [Ligilactobacillus hayakitensis DSM 18933 = JCM 14209]|uniref:Lysr family transcriptional regulator n=1 Tax=Ligilactobacillus hayakitensis DSM 18933 = JCM 14209 TaxID=1423755 RepID=A0A0R1WLH7_9LACO|nr:LysR family transcriptional regulator [Ligilactobacillus hayakitensis]KRM18826.1 lysr family transcriptional regulator [Ligilactobacillus hayakitensis DSM 18933 = JCM 14209]